MKNKVINILTNILKLDENIIEEKIEIPPKKEMGDFAFPTFFLAKELKKNPNIIAQELKEQVEKENDGSLSKIEQAGPYINFFLSNDIYTESFKNIYKQETIQDKKHNEKIVIDYIGANVGKPLHIGHMCTPNLGEAIKNTYKKLGYNVIGDSHIGDWGIIFGKLIIAYKHFGNEQKLKNDAVEHLFELYVKATELEEKDSSWNDTYQDAFSKLSSGDEEYISYWKLFTKESIKSAQNQLDKLNVKADYNIGESFYEGLNLPKLENYPDLKHSMKDIVDELIEKNIAIQNDDGSVGVVFNDNTPSCILRKRNGTHGYLASDLAAIRYRVEEFKADKIIYFVDVRQQLHLQQAFKIAKQAGWVENTELIHASNGFVKLIDGAMSSRKGKIIKLEELLETAQEYAKDILKEKGKDDDKLAEIIGIGAIKYEYLRKNRELDITFKWDEFMSFEGNCAPYIMYTYTRGKSILDKSGVDINNKINIFNFANIEEFELIKKLGEYKDILEKTVKENYPHVLANYIYELTKLFNSFYANIDVLGEDNKDKKLSKLALIEQTTDTIKDGFNLLGINLPEKM